MAFKIRLEKFALGYSISLFLITFGNIAFFTFIPLDLLIVGATFDEMMTFLSFTLLISLIISFLAPLIGHLSDKKKNGSRRLPYLIFGIVGMSLVVFLYYFSPLSFGSVDVILNSIYFLVLYGFNAFCSLVFHINYRSLYPENFQNLDSRSNVTVLILGFSALSSLVMFLLEIYFNFREIYFGIIFSLLIILGGIILYKFGFDEPYLRLSEKPKIDEQSNYKILSRNNKVLIWFLVVFFFVSLSEILIEQALFYNWETNLADPLLPFIDIILILKNIIPGIAIIAFLLFWRKLSLTIGIKNLLKYIMLALFVLTIALIFLADLVSGFILMFLINAGLSGLVFVKYLFLAIIIDNYYLNTSKRREATYYGVSSIFAFIPAFVGTFLAQFSTIFALIFVSPFSGIHDYYLFSKIGICLVALIFIGISIILIRKFPLDKERYNSIENEIVALNTRS